MRDGTTTYITHYFTYGTVLYQRGKSCDDHGGTVAFQEDSFLIGEILDYLPCNTACCMP